MAKPTRKFLSATFTLLGIVWVMANFLPACGNDCDFFERCNGNTKEVCGGVDQIVNRKIQSFPCEAPNALCVELNEHQAECVHDPETVCDASTNSVCDGNAMVFCDLNLSLMVAMDCTSCAPGVPNAVCNQ